jgi:hypothetical protein
MKRTASNQGGKFKPKPPSKPVVPKKEKAAQNRAEKARQKAEIDQAKQRIAAGTKETANLQKTETAIEPENKKQHLRRTI